MALHPRHLIASAILAALALPALAQAPATPAMPHSQASAENRQPGDWQERHRARMQQRTADLKAQLKLTPAQEPAWTSFTAAMQPGQRHARLNRDDMAQLTTPERIDRMRALRAQHAAEADRRGEATKAFYATLTPEQQKTFDAKTLRQHRHGGMGKGRGEGHHGAMHHGHHSRGDAAAPRQ